MVLDTRGRSFKGLENSLLELHLRNASLGSVPELLLPALRILCLTHNRIQDVPIELASNLTSLRRLDVSYNQLQVRLTSVLYYLLITVDVIKEVIKQTSYWSTRYVVLMDLINCIFIWMTYLTETFFFCSHTVSELRTTV
jgi:hypothetical protein